VKFDDPLPNTGRQLDDIEESSAPPSPVDGVPSTPTPYPGCGAKRSHNTSVGSPLKRHQGEHNKAKTQQFVTPYFQGLTKQQLQELVDSVKGSSREDVVSGAADNANDATSCDDAGEADPDTLQPVRCLTNVWCSYANYDHKSGKGNATVIRYPSTRKDRDWMDRSGSVILQVPLKEVASLTSHIS